MIKKSSCLKSALLGTTLILSQLITANSSFGQAASSVYTTGKYRNLQVDYDGIGSDPANRWYADYKLLVNYQWMFNINPNPDLDTSGYVIYYDVSGGTEGYVLDVNNNDIRSEGMSYGMMIAVQMNDQTTFDKLWRFAKNHMRQSDGHFAWHVSRSSYSPIDTGGAPDGEEYMAMSLFFAANRWGNNTNMNYSTEANAILDVIRTQYWDSGNNMIKFISNAGYTDPSYHLPAFYELWGQWATSNNQFWKNAAASSRAFLKKASNSTTGLFSEYMNFNGTPTAANTNGNADSGRFAYDSWRVIQNMATDYYWWSGDNDLKAAVEKEQTFFESKGLSTYVNRYELNGTAVGSDRSQGHVMMNSVGSLVGTGTLSQDFCKEALLMTPPTGQYRYYDGVLYLLGFMHISGNYRIYGPGAAAFTTDKAAASKVMAQPQITLVNTTPNTLTNFTANYYITVENGKTPYVQAISMPDASVSMVQIQGNLWAAKLNYAGKSLAPGARIPASGDGDMFSIQYTDGSTFDKSNDYSQPIGTALLGTTDRISVFNNQGQLVMGKDPLIKTIVVRARGTGGGEQITLKVNNTAVKSWTLSTTMTNYTATTTLSGGSLVQYTNDSPNHDVIVDYLSVDGAVRQAEDQTVNTGYFNGSCGAGGVKSEWMHCNGYIGFGNL